MSVVGAACGLFGARMTASFTFGFCASTFRGWRSIFGMGTHAIRTSMSAPVAVIPSRYAAQRFPGKPLALISGKPMIPEGGQLFVFALEK